MPATTTLATLLSDLAEELDLGLVIAAGTGTTTTITEADTGVSELRGPFTGLKIAVGSPVTVITGGTVGEDTFVSAFSPSTGVITLSPAITTAATGFIIWKPWIKHSKNVEKAVSRAHQKCRRWMKVPLTYVADGEMLGAVASFWTAAAGTASYVSLASPEVAAAQVLNLTHSAATNVQSNTIQVRPSEVWSFETSIRATTAAGVTAALVVYDVTNSVAITPTYEEGDGDSAFNAFVTQKGTLTIPATCDQLAFRLTLSASGTVQMSPIIAAPQDAMSFPFTNRVLGIDRLGNYYYSRAGNTTSGPDERGYSDPITTSGRIHTYSNNGDHLVVSFNFVPGEPVWYDELIYGGALTAMTDTVIFPANYVLKQSRAEIYDWLVRSEAGELKRADSGSPLMSIWLLYRNAAIEEANSSLHEPQAVHVVGRR